MTQTEKLDELVVHHMNIILEQIWDIMNSRPANTHKITVNGETILVSVLEKVSDEVEILTFTHELETMIARVNWVAGHKYFTDYIEGIDAEVQMRINEILKNINT